MKLKFTPSPVLYLLFIFLPASVYSQTGSIQGKVADENSEPVPYATVQLQNTTMGATTDDDGNYQISTIPAGTYVLTVSYVGYSTHSQEVTVGATVMTTDIVLKSDYQNLDEVVVVGYGTQQTRDLTGSITSISSKDFNTGIVSTPDQLIVGKIAGVEIISNSGAPGAGSRIRIRGGTSLNASNDPLIVIDGVPVDNATKADGSSSIAGAANPLNLINPADIENITILKDASAAAIYGSRAANGVILITTKKGPANSKFNVNFSTTNSVSQITDYAPVLSADQFRSLIDSIGTDPQKALLGTSNTDWQKEIYQLAYASDNNITFTGGIKNLPYRLNLAFLYQEGILKRSILDRGAASLSLAPSFLDNHLQVTVNAKYAHTYNIFPDQGAIGSAVTFDPTQPVYAPDSALFGPYFEWLDPATDKPNVLAPKNPVGLIYQKDDKSNVDRFIGNIQFDYKLHFLPELRANLNMGGDWARSEGTIFVPDTAASQYYQDGQDNQYKARKNNKLFEFYLNYTKELKGLGSKIDLTGGYSYQDWLTDDDAFPNLSADGDTITAAPTPNKTQNTLISFYGRLNYTFLERFLITATLRDDGSSRFSPDTRWGLFPSFAFAWRISDESFLKNSGVISNLKLRLGYGETGQQDIFADYPYLANYDIGESTAQYQFGNQFYYVLRPNGYDANIKWETTTTLNAGLDFGLYNGRINGSIDIYKKNTDDLLAVIPVPAGTNFTNQILTNVGSMENKGVEVTLNFVPVDTRDFHFEFGVNGTLNRNEVTNLTKVEDTSNIGILVGGISGGIGNTIQIHSVGYPTFTFFVYEQLYDEDGNPIVPVGNAVTDTAAFADLNNDGRITPDDRYHYTSPEPKFYAGFYTAVAYKNWSAGFSLRASFENYVYNNVNSTHGTFAYVDGSKNYINNIVEDYYNTEFQKNLDYQFQSDYYVEDATFLRMDNLSIGYNFKNLLREKYSLRITGIVQNVFVLSGYSGLDPEIVGGIDNSIYPRPRIYSINLNLNL